MLQSHNIITGMAVSMDVLRLTIWLLYLCVAVMVALAEATIFIRFDRTPPYQSRLDTAIFHYSVIGLNGSNLCNKNGCSILCEVNGQTLTSCPADSIVLNNLTINRKHHFCLNVTTKDGKRNSSSYRWFIGRAESPTQLLLEVASAKLTTSKRITTGVLQKNMPIKS